jgi:hypothetical protein
MEETRLGLRLEGVDPPLVRSNTCHLMGLGR